MFLQNDRLSKEKRISLTYACFFCWFTIVKTWLPKYYHVSLVVYSALSDITCFYNNVTYTEGEEFPDIDGCNNWYEPRVPHTCI